MLQREIIILCCNYIDNLDTFRQCSKYLMLIVGNIYFNNKIMNSNKINKANKYLFRKFAHKYNLKLIIENIKTLKDLLKFYSFNVKEIIFHDDFNELYVEYCLPHNLKKINFSCFYDKRINKLPNTITHIDLRGHFNNQIKKLPSMLECLYLGDKFSEIIKLPKKIKYLRFGVNFNKLIHISHLNYLEYLCFGYYFNYVIKLPISLKTIVLHEEYIFSNNFYYLELPLEIKYLEITKLFLKDESPDHQLNLFCNAVLTKKKFKFLTLNFCSDIDSPLTLKVSQFINFSSLLKENISEEKFNEQYDKKIFSDIEFNMSFNNFFETPEKRYYIRSVIFTF